MSHTTAPSTDIAFAHCRNCQFPLGMSSAKFCPNCGQDTAPHPPSAWEFLHEFVGHYVALEGRLARTLALLIFRPGELTRRYLGGEKEQLRIAAAAISHHQHRLLFDRKNIRSGQYEYGRNSWYRRYRRKQDSGHLRSTIASEERHADRQGRTTGCRRRRRSEGVAEAVSQYHRV